jgi:hypothetical protein
MMPSWNRLNVRLLACRYALKKVVIAITSQGQRDAARNTECDAVFRLAPRRLFEFG